MYSKSIHYGENINRKLLLITILICCCCIIHRKRRQIRKRRKVYFQVVDWKQKWKMTLLIMVNLTVATAMNMMTSCDEGSSSPSHSLCAQTPLETFNIYPFLLLSAILNAEQCVNPLLRSSGDRILIKLLSAHCTPVANGERQIYSDGLDFFSKMYCMMWDIFDGGISSDWPK